MITTSVVGASLPVLLVPARHGFSENVQCLDFSFAEINGCTGGILILS